MRYLLLALVVSSFAWAEVVTPGPMQFIYTATDSSGVVVGGTSPVHVVLSTAQSCANIGQPYVQIPWSGLNFNPRVLMGNDLGTRWSYPQVVTPTNLYVQLCYRLEGIVYTSMTLIPILRDTITGSIYEPGNGQGIVIPPGTYNTSITQSPPTLVAWSLAGFPTSSLDWYNQRYEIGYRIRFTGQPPPFGVTDMQVVRMYNVAFRANFVTTAPSGSFPVGSPALTYTKQPDWTSCNVKVDVNRPEPSTATGVYNEIRCANGVYYQLDLVRWGAVNLIRTYSTSQMNSKCPLNAQLQPGNVTCVRSCSLLLSGAQGVCSSAPSCVTLTFP